MRAYSKDLRLRVLAAVDRGCLAYRADGESVFCYLVVQGLRRSEPLSSGYILIGAIILASINEFQISEVSLVGITLYTHVGVLRELRILQR